MRAPSGSHALAMTALVSLISLSSAARAADGMMQTAVPGSLPHHGGGADGWHIQSLHDRLKITPDQEALWTTVADIMRANDEKIDALTQARHEKAATMTAAEDLRSFAAITEAHAAGMRTFIPAFESLYQAMSPAQQANADQVFRGKGRK
jgi:Spy/CpxP family protein refolding chaperone